MIQLQDIIDKCDEHECHLSKGIYIAPLIISHPCKIYGDGSIIIISAKKKVEIRSSGVELYDLRIESESNTDDFNFICQSDTKFYNVIFKGDFVVGSQVVKDVYPSIVNLGLFNSDSDNSYQFELISCEDCSIICDAADITIVPEQIKRGQNTISIHLENIRSGTTLYTKIKLVGTVTREILIHGEADSNAPLHTSSIISLATSDSCFASVHSPPIIALPPDCSGNKITKLQRGQRIQLSRCDELKIKLDMRSNKRNLDVDGYAFLLGENGKVLKEQDLIFWGNKETDNSSIKLIESDSESYFGVKIGELDDSISKVVICYSIYGDDPNETFNLIPDPFVRLFVNEIEVFRFELLNLNREKTIVAIEIYRRNDSWRLSCVGSGYQAGLRRMCEDYGIEVAD